MSTQIGLRVDVDTFRGTRDGVPRLCDLFAAASLRASFFFSVGPDNMGRHLWRLLRPSFLMKMLRSNAPGLYGWDILLRGTLWPGARIAEHLGEVIRATAEAGHEIGLHAWDHHAWQARVETMSALELEHELQRGLTALTELLSVPPASSAAPGWKCTEEILTAKMRLPFRYNSDCRGESIFQPVVDGAVLTQPQVPVTLPTYDEVIGRNGITDASYNGFILSQLRPDALNVLTIHAEVEGISKAGLFHQFLQLAVDGGASFVPLGRLLDGTDSFPVGRLQRGALDGREGWVAVQAEADGSTVRRAGSGT